MVLLQQNCNRTYSGAVTKIVIGRTVVLLQQNNKKEVQWCCYNKIVIGRTVVCYNKIVIGRTVVLLHQNCNRTNSGAITTKL